MYNKKAHLHFVGIGGIGMSGIAKILRYQGYTISGCDLDLNKKSIKELKSLGCTIYEGNNTPACHDPSTSIVVYSSAIQSDNPEIRAAQQKQIPTIPRALMLAELMRTKFSIAIAGSHGKTTTTSLISHILIEAKKDPTVIIGGHLKTISTNAQFGLGDFLVAEADESDKSLVHLQATIAIITNIDLEHLDVYQNLDDIKATFKQFLNNLPFYGTAIVCIDNEHVQSLLPLSHLKTIMYGITNSQADIFGYSIDLQPSYSQFNVRYKDKELGTITLHMPGQHNVLNSLASIALALDLEIPFETICSALSSFKGVERRFSYRGLYKAAEIFEDYGHHPEEIKQTIITAKNRCKNKLTMLFQPHRYSRTEKLWDEFIKILSNNMLDHLIITDIYPASESPIRHITAQKLVTALKEAKPSLSVEYVPYADDFAAIREHIDSHLSQDDLLLVQGAGKINKILTFLQES